MISEVLEPVHLVIATQGPGHQTLPLRVFQDRDQAYLWLDALIDYRDKEPLILDFHYSSKVGLQQFRDRLDAWRLKHPAGEPASYFRSFEVMQLPFEGTEKP